MISSGGKHDLKAFKTKTVIRLANPDASYLQDTSNSALERSYTGAEVFRHGTFHEPRPPRPGTKNSLNNIFGGFKVDQLDSASPSSSIVGHKGIYETPERNFGNLPPTPALGSTATGEKNLFFPDDSDRESSTGEYKPQDLTVD